MRKPWVLVKPLDAWRCVLLALLALGCANAAQAQGQEHAGTVVYRFALQGVADRVAAKPVQYALLDRPTVTMCTYVEECACFKLATTAPLDHPTLSAWVLAAGHALVGEVRGSDGSFLGTSTEPPEHR